MARVTPQQAAEKWSNRLSGASQDYTNGINNTTVDPAQLAIAQKDVAARNYQAAITSGRWAAKLSQVTPAAWKQAAITPGAPRRADGAAAAKPRMQTFFGNFLPQLDQITAQTRSMPSGSLDQNIARATAQMRAVAALKGKV